MLYLLYYYFTTQYVYGKHAYFRRYQDQQVKMEHEVREKRIKMKEVIAALEIEEDPEEELEVYDRIVNGKKHEATLNSLNEGQALIFKDVLNHVQRMKEDNSVDAIQLFVSGTAGTGKSHLINALADEMTLKFTDPNKRSIKPSVMLAAPTGLAAIQIRGSTIHSLLGINVQHGRDRAMAALSAEKFVFFLNNFIRP